jgi:hypothetical protein
MSLQLKLEIAHDPFYRKYLALSISCLSAWRIPEKRLEQIFIAIQFHYLKKRKDPKGH